MALAGLGAFLGTAGRAAASTVSEGIAQAGGRQAIMNSIRQRATDYVVTQGPRALFNAAGGGNVPLFDKTFNAIDNARNSLRSQRAQEAAQREEEARERARERREEKNDRKNANEDRKRDQEQKRAEQNRIREQRERENQEQHDEAQKRATATLMDREEGILRSIAKNTEETVSLLRNPKIGEGGSQGGGLLGTITTIIGMMAMVAPAFMGKLVSKILPTGLLAGKGLKGITGTVKGVGGSVFKTAGKTLGIGLGVKAGADALKASSSVLAKPTANIAKEGLEAGAKTGIGKIAGKTLLKSVVKKIPLLGLLAGIGFGAKRAFSGDFSGAGMEVASGLASTIPGLGTAASIGIDGALLAKDLNNQSNMPVVNASSDMLKPIQAPSPLQSNDSFVSGQAILKKHAINEDPNSLSAVVSSLATMISMMSDKNQGIYVKFANDPLKENHAEKKGFLERVFGDEDAEETSSGSSLSRSTGSPSSYTQKIARNQTSLDNEITLRKELTAQGITDPNEQAAILANFQAESNLTSSAESMNYSGSRLFDVFGTKYFKDKNDARNVASQGAEAIGNRVYGGRMGNAKDEGYKYRGRGFVQLTGKDNYKKYSQMIFGDDRLVDNPDLLEDPSIAAKVSVAYVKDRTKGNYSLENVTRAIAPRNLNSAIQERRSLVGNFMDGTPGLATGGNIGSDLVKNVSADLYAQTQAAIDNNVRYKMGSKNVESGAIDCSGWVTALNRGMIDSLQTEADDIDLSGAKKLINQGANGGAAGMIKSLAQASGELLHGENLNGVEDLREGMSIGIRGGKHAKGRFKDIGHIVQVVKDPKTGELMISESSSSGGGVKLTKASEWMDKQNKDKLYGVDTFQALNNVTNGGLASALQAQHKGVAPMLAQSQAEVDATKTPAPVIVAPQTTVVQSDGKKATNGSQPATGTGAPLQTRNPNSSIAAVNNSRMNVGMS